MWVVTAGHHGPTVRGHGFGEPGRNSITKSKIELDDVLCITLYIPWGMRDRTPISDESDG